MSEPKKLHLPKPYILSSPTTGQIDLTRAHSEGRLIYEAVDFPRTKLRVKPAI